LRARECEGTEISVSAENQARAKPQRPV
jgi:hypothetical protein